MNLDILQDFLFWCLVLNMGLYTLSALGMYFFREVFYKIIQTVFPFDDDTLAKSFYNYVANYKLLVTIFNFVPWLAIMIVNSN